MIVEGKAEVVRDEALLRELAGMWEAKFDWHFDVGDGAFRHEGGGKAPAYEVRTTKAFARGRGETSSATRYRF